MTYCVALCLEDGIVFLSDTRTNAGVDQISTFRKMAIFQKKNDRLLTLLSAGNLAITQSVKEILSEGTLFKGVNLWNAKSAHEAAIVVGEAVRLVRERDAKSLENNGIEFNCSFILGGQIKGERPRLFNVYAAGNFIESTVENCYFQIGESKYGKPIIDRVINFNTPLHLATKCALISMDSTLKSNISVGLPLDLLVYEKNSFDCDKLVTIDETNPYFTMIHNMWGEKLKQVFLSIEEPVWSNKDKKLSLVSNPKKLGQVGVTQAPSRSKKISNSRSVKPAAKRA